MAGGYPDLDISEEAKDIKNSAIQDNGSERLATSSGIFAGAQSAWDMLRQEETEIHITTSCKDLDAILGGGVKRKEITEVGGVPGIGKTQLGMQLAVNVQIPVECGGVGGKAVYIDTEGSFMVERAFQIAEACIQDVLDHHVCHRKDLPNSPENLQPNTFLKNIFYFRICSYTEQIAVVNYLDKFIEEHRDVKLVVIDSITFHFRQDFEDLALRTRILGGMALKLMKLAQKYQLAVVLLNQVTTKITEGAFRLTLALGDSWSHACTNRVILYWNGNERYAYIDKSPSLKSASAPFAVTGKGIRSSISSCKKIKMM